MSEARQQRFEIDIEEIERQLRQSTQAAPAGAQDPLAELARIVGQDDPFRGFRAEAPAAAATAAPSAMHLAMDPANDRAGPQQIFGRQDPVFEAPPGCPARQLPPQGEPAFDPVLDAYGSQDAVLQQDDIRPLQPRRSRGRLAAVMAALLVSVGAVAGGLYWKRSGGSFLAGGTPPIITADKTPLKVAPENPGGMDVPNQDRQIYERKSTDGQSRVVDGREQPIDIREAAKLMPVPTVSARAPVPSADPAAPQQTEQRGNNAVANVLGEPRRVRTVAVRPDGTEYTPTTTSSVPANVPNLVPGNSLPPPVQVATVSVPNGPAQPAAQPQPVSQTPQVAETSPAGLVTSSILPPRRPSTESSSSDGPVRTASADASSRPEADKPARKASFVQLTARPSEEEAREALSSLKSKFASDLDGRRTTVSQAEVRGKTVHRVRVGPLTRDDADSLCDKLKSSGGSCMVIGKR